MSDIGPVEQAIRSYIQIDPVADVLLDALKAEWSAEMKDKHLHSFDSIALCDDYCQVDGCEVTYEEYLAQL